MEPRHNHLRRLDQSGVDAQFRHGEKMLSRQNSDKKARRRYHIKNFEQVGMDYDDLDLVDAFEEEGEGRRNRSRRRGIRKKRRKTRRGRHHYRSRKRQHKKRHSRKRHSRKGRH